jgi:hypothetical protein
MLVFVLCNRCLRNKRPSAKLRNQTNSLPPHPPSSKVAKVEGFSACEKNARFAHGAVWALHTNLECGGRVGGAGDVQFIQQMGVYFADTGIRCAFLLQPDRTVADLFVLFSV